MKPRLAILVPLAGLALLVGVASIPDAPANVAPDVMHLSLEPDPLAPGVHRLGQAAVPPDCSSWHELFPAYCVMHHQDGYGDNGDGEVSVCDEILLDGVTWHITWVGPTYYLTCYPPGAEPVPVVWEPNQGPHDPANPICETWQEVHPDFGTLFHIDDWADNDMSGNLTPCDEIWSGGLLYHVDDIGLDIIVEPPQTPVEPNTWGRIKSWFRSIGD